jgi:hypothetical protein
MDAWTSLLDQELARADEGVDGADLERYRQRTQNALRAHLALAQRTHEAIVLALHYAEETGATAGDSKRIVSSLVARLAQDLHAISRLAADGYAYQAVALAACSYEYAMMQISIGTDEARAQQWLEHDKTGRNLDNVETLTRLALKKLDASNPGLSDRLEKPYEEIYRKLCLFKHANPIVQQHIGVRAGKAGRLLPDSERRATIASCWALEAAIRCAWLALASYAGDYVPVARRDAMRAIAKGINREFKEVIEIRKRKESETEVK